MSSSFFIKKNKDSKGKNKKKIKRKSDHQKDGSTSSLFPKKSKKLEEIISSDSEDDGSNNRRPGRHSSEDEEMEETAHERKIRLAKKYLEQIEREEEDRIESNEIDSSVVIRNRLRQDVLESAGRFIKKVSQDYTGIDLGNARHLKNGHRLSITCLVSCSSKNVIFTGGKEGRLIKWCLKTCQKLKIIPEIKKDNKTDVGHSSSILSLAISSDSKFLTSCDESNSIKVWDPETLNLYKNLTGHRAPVTGLSFRKSTHTLYSCSKDRTVKVWNLETETDMAYLETLFGHQESITSIDSLFKERLITSGGTDSTIRIWKIIEESQLVFQATNGTSIDTVKYLDEQHFLSGSDDGSISLWGIQKKKPLFTVPRAHGVGSSTPNWITAIATLVNTDIFASGSQDSQIRVWKVINDYKKFELMFCIPIVGFINCLEFSSTGHQLIAGVGQEHKNGRWWKIKEAKNHVVIIPFILSNNNKLTDGQDTTVTQPEANAKSNSDVVMTGTHDDN